MTLLLVVVQVVRTALVDAASVAGLMVTTEAAIADLPSEDKPMMGARAARCYRRLSLSSHSPFAHQVAAVGCPGWVAWGVVWISEREIVVLAPCLSHNTSGSLHRCFGPLPPRHAHTCCDCQSFQATIVV